MAKSQNTANKKHTQVKTSGPLQIPARLLAPVGEFLRNQLRALEQRRQNINTEDPFVSGRNESLASPDANAAEQFGHARSVAVRGEVDKKIIQIRKALSRVRIGKYGACEECGEMINTDRLVIYPEAALCIKCEGKKEKKTR